MFCATKKTTSARFTNHVERFSRGVIKGKEGGGKHAFNQEPNHSKKGFFSISNCDNVRTAEQN